MGRLDFATEIVVWHMLKDLQMHAVFVIDQSHKAKLVFQRGCTCGSCDLHCGL